MMGEKVVRKNTHRSVSPIELGVILDEEDMGLVSQWRWKLSNGYPVRRTTINGKQLMIRLHRFLLPSVPRDMEIDHINGNKLDNRKNNLRAATSSQNKQNRNVRSDSTTGLKGVIFFRGRSKPYRSVITLNGKRNYLGYFSTPQEAHIVYVAKAKELFGEFANAGLPTEVPE